MKQIIFLTIILSLHIPLGFAQINNKKTDDNKTKALEKKDTTSVSEQDKKQQEELRRMNDEASHYAAVRYAIVHNYIFRLSLDEGRMDILMDEQQLNEESLIKVFELIKKRFPLPLRLAINVHTSLATIETPEENEMAHASNDPRFAHTYGKYREAFYMRFENGRESFSYTINLSPFKKKQVVLKDIK